MNSRLVLTSRVALALALTFSAAPAASAQEKLPAGADIIARYQKAIGGAAAVDAMTSMHMIGTFSVPAAGMTAPFEGWSARPNRTAMKVTVPGFGEIRSGYTGEIGWSMNPAEGPRLMTGAEADQAKDEAAFDSFLRPSSLVKSATTVELTKLGDQPCYKVRIEWTSGRESFDCYSPDTGLLIGKMETTETSMGSSDAVTIYSDYKPFGGVRMPTKLTIQMLGMEQVITLTDIRLGADAAAALELPAEIKALIGK